ncbi:VOC family protein [Spartinivicinus ruber]|uniref:VOC family protein n=1 Tax=Spartinivicinus ruber TaxID=2683272 RepID=UPI0013D2D1B1|nr:VOC family protein [Spartinivicinus ruber]
MYEISAVQINVHDMDEALDFYCGKLGFEEDLKDHYPQVVTLKNEGFFLLLTRVEEKAELHYPVQSQTLINFRVRENLENLVDKLKSNGVKFLNSKPEPCPVGVYIPFKDPSGNVHEFVEFREG